MINEQELNKKLAEWLGWVDVQTYVSHSQGKETNTVMGVVGTQIIESVFFTESQDTCNKWLVPKLIAGDDYTVHMATNKYHTTIAITPHYEGLPSLKYSGIGGDTPALALCLAIEKLIDSVKGVIKANKKD